MSHSSSDVVYSRLDSYPGYMEGVIKHLRQKQFDVIKAPIDTGGTVLRNAEGEIALTNLHHLELTISSSTRSRYCKDGGA